MRNKDPDLWKFQAGCVFALLILAGIGYLIIYFGVPPLAKLVKNNAEERAIKATEVFKATQSTWQDFELIQLIWQLDEGLSVNVNWSDIPYCDEKYKNTPDLTKSNKEIISEQRNIEFTGEPEIRFATIEGPDLDSEESLILSAVENYCFYLYHHVSGLDIVLMSPKPDGKRYYVNGRCLFR